MKGLLFFCVANSARSQMAEGLARQHFGCSVVVQSAGSRPFKVNPLAVRVMFEVGIDISQQVSKSVDAIEVDTVDTVVTLCAEEGCPAFLELMRRLSWPLVDPAGSTGTEAERLQCFRDVRDEIKGRIKSL
jgi:arsenate reductase